MSPQADFIVSNGTGAAVRSDLNVQFAAIVSNNSGATEPATMYAYQWWADTTTGLLKLRNSANSAWISLRELDGTLTIEDGTAAAPGLAFTSDLNTGLFRVGADQVAISTGGTSRLAVSTTAVSSTLAVDVTLGAVGTPSLTFTGDLNTGVYSPGADQVAITTAGVQRVNFNAATEVVFNDGGADVDFRIEGDTNPDLFKIDAGLDEVQVANLNGGPLAGTRNRVINGDMRIDQRNAGASVTPANNTYTLDRWKNYQTTASKYSVQQNAGSVTPPSGFTNYLGITSLSAYSVLSSDYYTLQQPIEGFNIADLAWGTASAKAIIVSFWVRSSLTGTFGGSLFNAAGARSYPFSYTITVANTWELKTITILGDTSGTWTAGNTAGIQVCFGLGAGSTYTATAGAWAAGLFTQPTSSTSVVGTSGATFYITGVQLEPGPVATPFERRSYGQELALCQRYYMKYTSHRQVGYALAANDSTQYLVYPVIMRAAPTLVSLGGGTSSNASALNFVNPSNVGFGLELIATATGRVGIFDNSFQASAEL